MKELTCIVCPRGCRLRIDETRDFLVMGNGCERGIDYAKAEISSPVRTLTSTVKIVGACHPRLHVKTNRPIPKKLLWEAMTILNRITVHAPIRIGDVIVKNIAGSGADLTATRDM